MKLVLSRTYRLIAILGCLFFTVSSVFVYIKVQERNAYMHGFITVSLSNKTLLTRDDTVLTLANSIYSLTKNDYGVELQKMDWYERFESTFFFNMSSTVALKYGGYGVRGHYVFGPCGTMSRTLLNALWDLDIPARKLQLLNNQYGKGGGHTMVEYFDNGKWKVIAPSDQAQIWRNQKGEIASVAEIQSDRAIFNQVYERYPQFPYLFDNPRHINWSKLPVWVQESIKTILGEERFNTMETPRWYDHPRQAIFYACLFFLGVSLMILGLYYRNSLYKIVIKSIKSTIPNINTVPMFKGKTSIHV